MPRPRTQSDAPAPDPSGPETSSGGSAAAPALSALVRVVRARGRREPQLGIGPVVESMARQARSSFKKLGAAGEAWLAATPAEIARHCRLEHLRAGVLSVVADDASTAWELDRLLRTGLEERLRSASRGAVTRVKVRAGATPR